MPEPPLIRSYLYAPGSNPRVMEKALQSDADAVILDLEDSVPAQDKLAARESVAALLSSVDPGMGAEVHVRINRGPDGPDLDDLAAVTVPGLTGIRLPKVSSADEVGEVASRLDTLERSAGMAPGTVLLYLTIETAAAAMEAVQLAAAPRVARLVFGATDFLADIRSPGTADGPATHTARGMLVLASSAVGVGAPVDSVHVAIDDEEGLRRGALFARELGFFGKSLIHPRQIAPVHDVFTPSDEEISEARRVVSHADEHGDGATTLDGQMIDAAVVARARNLIALTDKEHA